MSASPHKAPRPSDARCDRLLENISKPSVSSFFPIENYYQIASKVYDSFQEAFLLERPDDAYVYGKRYCLFCVEQIPSHDYYKLPKYKHLADAHNAQVSQVLTQLEIVRDWIDTEELKRERQLLLEEEEKERAADEQRQAKLDDYQRQFEQHQQRQKQSKSAVTSEQVKQSAFAKLKALSNGYLHTQHEPQSVQSSSESVSPRVKQDPSGEVPVGQPRSRYRLLDSESDDDDAAASLPPPVPPPAANGNGPLPPPPSYQSVASRRNYLGPSKIHPTSLLPPPPRPAPSEKRPSMAQITQRNKQAYMDFHQAGRIRVTPIPSYQGRISASTNGCTVISALCAANHLRRDITTDTIVRIMDQECVPLLQQIRSKLGLDGCALIIPSDVHDYLVDHKILKQDEFEGAAGGNILDPQHFGSFTKLLAVGDDGKGHTKKAAATLFFREHVISIVKLTGGGKVRYDLIDSLPGITTNGRPMATRTHCQDLESLEVMLKWYCSRKFNESNCTYIDRNGKWDDAMADFDPRVFQGFVWMPKL